MRKIFDIIVFMVGLLMVVAAGCGRSEGRLQEIDALAEVDAAGALAALDSIEVPGLGKSDRMLYELIRLKAQDKEYVRQASDSVATMLVEYFRGSDREAEALYYCGRVNCDLGDYPTALRYFNEAESSLEKQRNSGNLYLSVLSQKGRLLSELGLHSEGIAYLEKTVQLSEAMNDTLGLPFDYQRLASAHFRRNDFDNAVKEIRKALSAGSLSDVDRNFMRIYLAAIYLHQDSIEASLKLIEGMPQQVDSVCQDFVMSVITDVFHSVGKQDSAFKYAKQIIEASEFRDKLTAYKILVQPDMQSYIGKDSFPVYLDRYLSILKERYNEHDSEAAIAQNSMYNYAKYQEGYAESLVLRNRMLMIYSIMGGMILLFVVIFFYNRFLHSRQIIRMQKRFIDIERNREEAKKNHSAADSTVRKEDSKVSTADEIEKNAQERESVEPSVLSEEQSERIRIINSVTQKSVETSDKTPSYLIKHSDWEGRALIEKILELNEAISPTSHLWNEIETMVEKDSKDFKHDLLVLSENNLSRDNYRLALLIKCGATPKDLIILLGRDKSTVSKRRRMLCELLFHEKGELRTMDTLIRKL